MSESTWRLHLSGAGIDRVVTLGTEPLEFGAAGSNAVVLAVEGVAPKHAVIEGKPGKYFLRDMQTRQGVFVNGRRTVLHRLQPGDRFKLGPVEFLVEAEGLASASAPPTSAPMAPPRPAPPRPAATSSAGVGTAPPRPASASPAPSPFASPFAQPPPPPAVASPPRPSGRVPAIAPAPRPAAATSTSTAAPAQQLAPQGAPYAAESLPIHALLIEARQRRASDLHLAVDLPPLMRINGELVRVRSPLSAAAVEALVQQAMTEAQWEVFSRDGDLDYCLIVGQDRYRANACRTRTGPSLSFRLIRERVPTLAELKLPPEVTKLTTYAQGLVLVTGPLGSGKTTSIMALVDLVNRSRHDHIITIEDPIEYLLPGVSCQVSQREVGLHTRSFESALRAALREDPDVVVIGDLRDYATARLAIAAAETGHLVFASMPAMNAMKTLDKLLDMFPASEQAVVRTTVSESLRGVLCQRLVPGLKGELVPAVELLINSVAIANIIRDGKTSSLKSAMQTGRAQGMRTLNMSIEELVRRGEISPASGEQVLGG